MKNHGKKQTQSGHYEYVTKNEKATSLLNTLKLIFIYCFK